MKLKSILYFLFFIALTSMSAASLNKGVSAYENKDYISALQELKPLAEQGDPNAQFYLGELYYNAHIKVQYSQAASNMKVHTGIGTYEDTQKYLNSISKIGRAKAEYRYRAAFPWYEKASNQGHIKAKEVLGNMYIKGKGTEKDPMKGVRLLEESGDLGNKDVYLQLANIFNYGIKGVNFDKSKYKKWFIKSGAEWVEPVIKEADNHYSWDRYDEALYLYDKEATRGNRRAQYMLGTMYRYGESVDANLNIAFDWYRKSAEQDYSDAFYELAWMYENGNGTEVDYKESLYWYKKAKESNDLRANEKISKLSGLLIDNKPLASPSESIKRNSSRIVIELQKAKELLDTGVINEKEFETIKQRLQIR